MVLALGCAHQLPRIAAPAIASARLGTAPRPDSSTTPLVFTKAMACFGVIRVLPRAAERPSSAAGPCWTKQLGRPESQPGRLQRLVRPQTAPLNFTAPLTPTLAAGL